MAFSNVVSPPKLTCSNALDPSFETISEVFENAARIHPRCVAIEFESTAYVTYEELFIKVNNLTHSLRDIVSRAELVPVLLPRSIQQVAVILSLAKLGVAYVPLDIDIPNARLKKILLATHANTIITTDQVSARLVKAEIRVSNHFNPDQCLHAASKFSTYQEYSVKGITKSGDVAAVLFTSGSTGEPKGVLLSHRNLLQPVRMLSQMEKIDSTSRIFQFASCSFDVHLIDIFCAVLNGATLCQVCNESILSDLAGWITTMRGQIVHLTPSVISLLNYRDVSTLKYMITCGEPVTREIVQEWSDKLVLINLYGPCEASSVIAKVLTPSTDPSILGKPSPHASIRLLDEFGRSVSTGCEGEICCSGESVALGYIGDDIAAKGAFRPATSFDAAVGWSEKSIVYATGDYGMFTSTGDIRFLGRRDTQVKINGQRVDWAEISEVLSRFSQMSCIIPLRNAKGQVRLFAFISTNKFHNEPMDDLKVEIPEPEFLKELDTACRVSLPSYMIPRILVVSAMPLNANGKLDRARLEQCLVGLPNLSGHDQNQATGGIIVDTTSSLEQRIGSLVASRLSGNVPSDDDDLRLWGMTSLDYMGLIKDLKLTFNVSFTFQEVFNSSTTRGISSLLRKKVAYHSTCSDNKDGLQTSQRRDSISEKRASSRDSIELAKEDTSYWVGLSPGQELIFTAQSILQNHAYNCNFILEIKYFLIDIERFISALHVVCSRHEILRSTYHYKESGLLHGCQNPGSLMICQKVHSLDKLLPEINVHNLEEDRISATDERKKALSLISQETHRTFDLKKDSPVRLAMYQITTDKQNWIVHFNIHHIAIDEWAFDNLCRELDLAYQTLELGKNTDRPLDRVTQYSLFARHNIHSAQSERNRKCDWWIENMELELFDSVVSVLEPREPAKVPIKLEQDESSVYTRALNSKQARCFEAMRCEGSTPFVGWLALCQAILARMTNMSKFLLAVPVTDRGLDPHFYDIVGFCLNTLLFPVRVNIEDTFESLLVSTQQTYEACVAHSTPYQELLKALKDRFPARKELRPEIMFAYHDPHHSRKDDTDSTRILQGADTIQLESVGSRFDLVIHLSNRGPVPHLIFEYRRSLFSGEFIGMLWRAFETGLSDIVLQGSHKALHSLECVSATDHARITRWSAPCPLSRGAEAAWAQGGSILLHELVEQTAKKIPEAIAIRNTRGASLTYGKLLDQSRVLSEHIHIRNRGLTSISTVLIFLQQSTALVVAQLAVLMSGMKFITFDPLHRAMLSKSKANAVQPIMVILNSRSAPLVKSLQLGADVAIIDVSNITQIAHFYREVPVAPDHDAYLCFTSESSNDAQLFSIGHTVAVRSILRYIYEFGLVVGDRVGIFNRTNFHISILETFATLAAGATLCITSTDTVTNSLADQIKSLSISHIFATPTMMSTLADPAQVPSLRFITLLDEPVSTGLLNLWIKAVDLRYAKGPVAIISHTRKILPEDTPLHVHQRTGNSASSLRSYILGPYGQLSLPLCIGYLYFSGLKCGSPGQSTRKNFSPVLGNEGFIDHPVFGNIFNSGELGFYSFDGELNLLGRQDDRVRLGGFIVNLLEIELITDSLCTGKTGAIACTSKQLVLSESTIVLFIWIPRLASSIMPADTSCGDSYNWLLPMTLETRHLLQELRSQASKTLHSSMVPEYWLPIRSFPVTVKGNVDRKILKLWFEELDSNESFKFADYAITDLPREPVVGTGDSVPQTALGRTLLESWKAILQVGEDQINTSASFFQARGDSISAIRFVSHCRSKGIIGCTVSQLYATPTLKSLHEALEPLQSNQLGQYQPKKTTSQMESPYVLLKDLPNASRFCKRIELVVEKFGIPNDMVQRVYPTTSMQNAMLLQSKFHAEYYAAQIIVRYVSDFDASRMVRAWSAIGTAHPAFRTTFVPALRDGILSFFSVELTSSTRLQMPARLGAETDLVEEELRKDRLRGFELGGPMFRLWIPKHPENHRQLIFSYHHASCDGWSLGILLRDLARAYQGLPLLQTPSFSHAVGYDAARSKEEAKEYWQRYLDDYNPVFVSSYNLSAAAPAKMATLVLELRTVSAESLSNFVHNRHFTPATIFQAALLLLMSKMTMENDIVIGVVVSGRNLEIDGATEMVGNFLNTIPLRTVIDRNIDTTTWLERLYQRSTESIKHDHLSLQEILRQRQTHTSLFETVLIFENQANLDQLSHGNLKLEAIEGHEYSEVPLSVILEHTTKGLRITFKFNELLLTKNQAESMLHHYADIVIDILSSKGSIKELGQSQQYPELSAAEHSIMRLKTQLKAEVHNETLVSMLNKTAEKFPSSVAIETHNEMMTYSTLHAESNITRDFLGDAGIGPGHTVPILFDHSIDMIISIIGILKAGAAYCPIDTGAPESRVQELVRKVDAIYILGDSEFRSKFSDAFLSEFQFVTLEFIRQRSTALEQRLPSCPSVAPEDICYILYTSGSTGQPKGCMLTHAAVVNVVRETSSITQIKPGLRVLLFASYIFDACVIDIFGCLSTGGTLCLARRDDMLRNLNLFLVQWRIDYIHLTPSVAQLLSPDLCPTLKILILGGEKVALVLRDKWSKNLRFYDGYGPTECAVQVSTTLLSPSSDVGVISQPLPGSIIFLLDENNDICRVGQIGEICIGGCQLFAGYLKEQTVTQRSLRRIKAFDIDLFATGDLGRYQDDMKIKILGRKDTQVKLLGERIEVEEIEAILGSVQGVERCGVLIYEQQLHAIVERNCNASEISSANIREACLARLPERLIPLICFVPKVRLTANGKLDRPRIARELKTSLSESHISDDVLGTETEILIASLISNIVGHDPKDFNLSLQGNGLNSLGIMQLRASLSEHYGLSLSLGQLQSSMTIRDLGTLLEMSIASASTAEPECSAEYDHQRLRPASESQFAMWLAQERFQDDTYNIGRVHCLRAFDSRRLYDNLRNVIERMELFKTSFRWDPTSMLLQKKLERQHNADIRSHDLKHSKDPEAAIRKLCSSNYHARFNLEGGPLAHFWVITCGTPDCYLYYNIHHILVDEYTCDTILKSVFDACYGIPGRDDQASGWPLGPVDCVLQDLGTKDASLVKWAHELDQIVAHDRSSWPEGNRNAEARSLGTTATTKLPLDVLQNLKGDSYTGGISIFTTLLSIFQLLMHRYLASDDVIILTPISRRGVDVRTIRTLDNMTSVVPVRSRIISEDDFNTFAQRTSKFIEFARANLNLPADRILASVGSSINDQSIMFVFNTLATFALPEQVEDVTTKILRKRHTMFDICLNVIEDPDGLSICVEYDTSKLAPYFIERLVTSYLRLLKSIETASMRRNLRDLNKYGDDEIESISRLSDIPELEATVNQKLLHQLFEVQVRKSPTAIAIEYVSNQERSLVTYEELDKMAVQVALALQDTYAISCGDIIPVYVEQSPNLIAAILGILKAGATYTPLPREGTWSLERIADVVGKCQSKIVIADASSIPGVAVTCLDVRSVAENLRSGAPACLSQPGSIAYVLWTSGTTGEPKALQISHSAAVTTISEISEHLYPRNCSDRTFQFSSPVFDVSVTDYFTTLSKGALLCMMPRAELLDDLHGAISSLKPTVANLTPSVASLLGQQAARFDLLVVSGEKLTQRTKNLILNSGTKLINAYGPAEFNLATYKLLSPEDNINCIGKSFSTVRVVILDYWGNVAPMNVKGEIFLGGPQMFHGYLNRPDLTEMAHLNHAYFGSLYRTGDFGYLDSSRNVIFCGRRDHQVKFNGQRLELDGLSAIIEESHHVKRAVVSLIESRLIAFFVYTTRRDTSIPSQTVVIPHESREKLKEVQDHVRRRMTSTVIPSTWLAVSNIPLTTNGKVDRSKLRELSEVSEADGRQETFVGPETEWEETIHNCCLEVLKAPICMTTNLFEQGLDSYSAMVLIAKLRLISSEFHLSFRKLMANSTLKALSTLSQPCPVEAEQLPLTHILPNTVLLENRQVLASYPSSSMQKRFCMAQEIFQDATYNIPVLLELRGTKFSSILRTLGRIINENAIFRTSFDFTSKEGLRQLVAPAFSLSLAEHDLSSFDSAAALQRMRNIIEPDLNEPFNIRTLPLMRCKAFKVQGSTHLIHMNFHHSIMDETSIRQLSKTLRTRSAQSNDEDIDGSHVEQSFPQYVDYCALEKQMLSDKSTVGNALHFWRNHLRDMTIITSPIAHARRESKPILATFFHEMTTPRSAFNWTRSCGITDFSTYLTSFQTLLTSLWGYSNPVILIPISQRPNEWVKPVYGCFTNTVPICAQPHGSLTLEENMRISSQTLLDVMENSFIPYETILHEAGLKAEDVQIMFIYQEGTQEGILDVFQDSSYGSEIDRDLYSKVKPKFAITFSTACKHEGQHSRLTFKVEYDSQRISASVVQSLCRHYEILIHSSMNVKKDFQVRSLNLLTEEELRLLETRRESRHLVDNFIPPVHHLIEKWARLAPDNIACCFEARSYTTYHELWKMIEGISEQLLKYDRHEDDCAAIFMAAGTDRIASIVATLRAGFAYVPLDPDNPALRNAAIVCSCKPQVILVSSNSDSRYCQSLENLLTEVSKAGKTIRLHSVDVELGNCEFGTLSTMPAIKGSNLAYVLYTSGSTGAPKGVQIEHKALNNALEEHRRVYNLVPGSRLLQFAPWTFDVSIVDILGTLSSGAILCIGSKDYLISRLEDTINMMEISHLATTPTIIGLLTPEKTPTLKVLAIGGEAMTRVVQNTWCRAVCLLNVYGPTEATVNVIYCRMEPDTPIGVIGTPMKNTKVFILDDQLRQVPLGTVGQLTIGGVQLARGYVDEALNKNSFVWHEEFGRMYLTGDLAKFTDDGNVHCLGRRDNQVKLRGQRIELEEIESVLGTIPEVYSVIALLVRRESFEALCVAFSISRSAASSSSQGTIIPQIEHTELISHLHEKAKAALPSYAVPSYWVPFFTIPTNRNGKLDRQIIADRIAALPDVELGKFIFCSTDESSHHLPPETEKEKIITSCVKAVLGVNEVYGNSNFFALSGDSISAIRLCTLAKHHGLRVTVNDVYLNPTITQLALASRDTRPPRQSSNLTTGIIRKTPIMEWFFGLGKQNPDWYCQTFIVRLKNPDDLEKLPWAWEALVRAHPMLRMRCSRIDGSDTLRISEDDSLSHVSVFSREFVTLQDLLDGIVEVTSCLNLVKGPVTAVAKFRTASEAYYVMSIHHLAVDVVSWQIILDDLSRLLREESILPEYGTFQEWAERVQQRQQQLKDPSTIPIMAEEPEIPQVNSGLVSNFAQRKDSNTVFSAKSVDLTADKDLTTFLLTKANEAYDNEPVDLLLASLVLALHRWRSAQGVEICFESHGRDFRDESVDVSRTVGWFTYMFSIPFSIHDQMPLEEIVARVRDAKRKAREKVDFSERFPKSEKDIPVITFNYLGSYSGSQKDDLFEVIGLGETRCDEDPRNLRSSVLDIGCGVVDAILTLSIIYSGNFHEQKEIRGLLNRWYRTLQDILHHCQTPSFQRFLTSGDFPSLSMSHSQVAELVRTSIRPLKIELDAIETIIPVTDMQRSMILASQESGAYLESVTYRITGILEVDRFAKAWRDVLSKHTALRTVFIICHVQDSHLRNDILQVVLKPEHVRSPLSLGFPTEQRHSFKHGINTMQLYLYKADDEAFRFTWDFHHAIIDGWSAGIVLNDFEQAYLGRIGRARSQSVDVERGIRRVTSSGGIQDFWKSELQDATPSILVDHSHGQEQSNQRPSNGKYEWTLGLRTSKLREFAASESMTISTLIRTAWALTLSYFSGRKEVIFGTTTSGRHLDIAGVEEVVGLCVNTIPYRVIVDDHDSRSMLLRKMHAKTLSLIPNEALSLRQIYRRSGVKDLFDTALVYQNYPKLASDPDLPFEMNRIAVTEATDIPLYIMVGDNGSGSVHVKALTHEQRFSPSFLDNLIAAFDISLGWISGLHNLQAERVSSLVLMTAKELQRVEAFGRGPELFPLSRNLTVWELFTQQAATNPSRPALGFYADRSVKTITYDELLEMAKRYAQFLYRCGVEPRDSVALHLDKSPQMVSTMLSVLSLGAAYMPINLESTRERIAILMQEGRPKLTILSKAHANKFTGLNRPLQYIEDIQEWIPPNPSTVPHLPQDANALATLLSTSGTTGAPKVVSMPNRQVAGYAITMAEAYQYDQESRIFAFANYTFDVSISDIFGGLCCGALVCMASQQATSDNLTDLLNMSQATTVNLTSSVASILSPEDLPCLRLMVLTGEPATRSLLQKWTPRIHVVNSYGPTEASVITWIPAHAEMDPRCVGSVVRGMDIMILDDSLRRVPIGVKGTIYTSGNQLSLGYLNKPSLTNEVFIINPYSPNRLMYNTGDLGAFDSSGMILCFQRKDRQVKFHGQRLELSEIEAAIGNETLSVTVSLLESAAGQPKLAAFFRSKAEFILPGKSSDRSRSGDVQSVIRELEFKARCKLPAYMVPSVFIPIDTIPLTSNGKADHAALQSIFARSWSAMTQEITSTASSPVTTSQLKLQRIVKDLFDIANVSIDTDLFSAILDSLSSMQLAARLRRAFDLPIRVQWIMENRTIRALGSCIDLELRATVLKPSNVSGVHGLTMKVDSLTTFSQDPTSKLPKLYCIHPVSGLSYQFRNIALAIPEMSVVGVNNRHFGIPSAYQNIEDMAHDYHAAIVQDQAQGPYHILGYSFGAHVALEVARCLKTQSPDVDVKLILVDSSVAPGALERFRSPERIEAVFELVDIGADVRSDEEEEFRIKLRHEVKRNLRLMAAYKMTSYSSPVVFLKANSSQDPQEMNSTSACNGYDIYMSNLRVETIYGPHYEIFTSNKFLDSNLAILREVLGLEYKAVENVLQSSGIF